MGNRKNPLTNFGIEKQRGNIIFSTLFTTYSGSLKNILICTSLLVLEIATINNDKMISFTSTLIEKNPSRFLFRRILTKQNTILLSTFHVPVRSQASHTPQFRLGINPLKNSYHWPTNTNFSPFWLIFFRKILGDFPLRLEGGIPPISAKSFLAKWFSAEGVGGLGGNP